MADSEWKQVIRLVHLDYGVRALNGPGGEVDVYPTADGTEFKVTIKTYAELFSELQSFGATIIGAEYIQDEREKAGLVPPEWRVSSLPYGWVGFDASQKWGQIAFSAGRAGEDNLADIASRLSFYLDACARSIFELSNAYSLELNALCVEGRFQSGQIRQTQNSARIFYATNNYFMNSGILRDVIAEFLSHYVYALTFTKPPIPTSMAKLVHHLRKKKTDVETEFTELLLKMTSEDIDTPGWIAELTYYRNLIMHQMPLAMALSGRGLIKTLERRFGTTQLPGVSMPIPNNAVSFQKDYENEKKSSSGAKELHQLIEAVRDPNARDALTFCHIFDVNLSTVALDILRFSPIAPKMPHLINIDGEIVVQDD